MDSLELDQADAIRVDPDTVFDLRLTFRSITIIRQHLGSAPFDSVREIVNTIEAQVAHQAKNSEQPDGPDK